MKISFLLTIIMSLAWACGAEQMFKKGDHIVFFGDSITQLGAKPQGYVSLLDEAITEQYGANAIKVSGKGISGNKVSNLLLRVERDVLALKPTHVFMYVGTNDVWHWTKPHPVTGESREGTTAEAYEAGLRELIAMYKKAGIKPIIATPAVIGENISVQRPETERLEQYVGIVRKIAESENIPLVDLRKSFVDYLKLYNPQNELQGVLTNDMVHMNDAGNRMIAKAFAEVTGVEFTKQVAGESLGKPDEVYLLIGQSNMAGRAPVLKEFQEPLKNCVLLHNAPIWVEATNPLNRYSTVRKTMSMQHMGPGYSFGREMVKAHKGAKVIGLVVNARGGSKIEQWKKGAPYYNDALARAKEAMKSAPLAGVIWHQGEGNKNDRNYAEKLAKMVDDLRADLGLPELPFVAGQIFKPEPVNEQIASLPKVLAHSAYVKSEGLSTTDGTHFDTVSQEKLGERYAKAMLQLHRKK